MHAWYMLVWVWHMSASAYIKLGIIIISLFMIIILYSCFDDERKSDFACMSACVWVFVLVLVRVCVCVFFCK